MFERFIKDCPYMEASPVTPTRFSRVCAKLSEVAVKATQPIFDLTESVVAMQMEDDKNRQIIFDNRWQ